MGLTYFRTDAGTATLHVVAPVRQHGALMVLVTLSTPQSKFFKLPPAAQVLLTINRMSRQYVDRYDTLNLPVRFLKSQ